MARLKKEITETKIYLVRSFVAEGCEGNPAGVCVSPELKRKSDCQDIARKIGASETAFVTPEDGIFRLRWFTPNGTEVDLCGHATLAAAFILWDKQYVAAGKVISFNTNSGILTARQKSGLISMDFPLEKIVPVKKCNCDIGGILGVKPVYLGKTKFDYLVVTDSAEDIKNMNPDLEKLKGVKARGISVTAISDSQGYDYVNRFFAPAVGIDEDPVTGSAHSYLGVFWSTVLNKKKLVGCQVSREGGIVTVAVKKDRVTLGGKAKEVKSFVKQ
ncbi:MAG: PhzF family phenazine biosynthesis protein [Dehalococcoidales bacterium]|nr:PhzF family phenazine biosynthesis protein [Dehalococcoidales bacterium]